MGIPRYETLEELRAPKYFRDHHGATYMFVEGKKEEGDRTRGLWVAQAMWGVVEAGLDLKPTETEEYHGYSFGKIRTIEPATPDEAMLAVDKWVKDSSRLVSHYHPLDEEGNLISLGELEDFGEVQLHRAIYDEGVEAIRAQFVAVPTLSLMDEY